MLLYGINSIINVFYVSKFLCIIISLYHNFIFEDSDGDETDHKIRKKMSSKGERYFWQYNIQAKGPKGQRLVTKTKLEDPHVLNEVTDPVFSPSCSLRGIKHR